MKFFCYLLALLPVLGHAQESGPTPKADTVSAAAASPLSFFGYAEAYYSYDLANPDDHRRPPFTYSHNRHNEFNINLALLGVRYQDERVRGALTLQAGTYPEANYANEPAALRHLNEAYAGVRIRRGLWLDAGIFASHIGMESARSTDNLTLSRSLMADNSPYYETGAKLTFEPTTRWTFVGLVLNGWQNITDRNQNKAFGTQIQFKPGARLLLNYSTFVGEGANRPEPDTRWRHFHDVYLTWQATPALKLAAGLDVGWEQKAHRAGHYASWQAGQLIARFQTTPTTAAVFRAEYFHDPHGVQVETVSDNNLRALGLSAGFDYAPTERALLRLEAKQYQARDAIFPTQGELWLSNTALTALLGVSF